ncbi:MAG TPA: hypothetical protein VGX92_21455 [Pyrinomonadaceae bacterium]|jgi:hypothetical protein|nr:hypothetical protein [Pyrinomonadaceae bacterium]
MSHHILQQFDEQWLAEIERGDALHDAARSLYSATACEAEGPSHRAREFRATTHRLFSIAALIIAAFALLLAHTAARRADRLQQRLDAHERASGR